MASGVISPAHSDAVQQVAALASIVATLPAPDRLLALYDGQNIDGLNNASLSDGQGISTWKNVATGALSLGTGADLTQGTAANQPFFRKIAASGKLRGLSAVEGLGSATIGSAAISAKGVPMTVFLVFSPNDIAATYAWFNGNTGETPQIATDASGNVIAYDGVSANIQDVAIVAGTWHCVIMEFNNTASWPNYDGSEPTAAVSCGSTNCDGLRLFSQAAGTLKAKGKIALAGIYNGRLVPRAAIHSAIVAQYGTFKQ